MSAAEKELRRHRRRNLNYMIDDQEIIDVKALARRLGCTMSYVSQMRSGHRAITHEMARRIEEIASLTHMSLDDPPTGDGKFITDKDIEKRVHSVLRDELRALGFKMPKLLFDALWHMLTVDARARGYSEGRIRHTIRELLR